MKVARVIPIAFSVQLPTISLSTNVIRLVHLGAFFSRLEAVRVKRFKGFYFIFVECIPGCQTCSQSKRCDTCTSAYDMYPGGICSKATASESDPTDGCYSKYFKYQKKRNLFVRCCSTVFQVSESSKLRLL